MKYTQALRNEIVKAIDFEGYTKFDGSPFAPQTDADKISLLINVAMDEVGHEFKAKGMQGGLEYWLSGLPSCINLPVYHYEQIEFAVKIGSIPTNHTERQANTVRDNFYRFMASNILQWHNKILKDRANGKIEAFKF